MELATASAVIGIIAGILKSVVSIRSLIDRFSDRSRAEKAMEALQSIEIELPCINASIADNRPIPGKNISQLRRVWIKQLRGLAYQIRDCLDNFERQQDIDKFAERIVSLSKQAVHIRTIHQAYDAVRSDRGGVADGGAEEHPDPDRGGAADGGAEEHPDRPVGMKNPQKELVELVELENPLEKLKVVYIVGFRGLGKTLLAKQVFDSAVQLKTTTTTVFALRASVTAANKNAEELLRAVLRGLRDSNGRLVAVEGGAQDEGVRQSLFSLLANQRYLIVIDNMPRTMAWEEIKSAFPCPIGVASRIIITTTYQPADSDHDSPGDKHVYRMQSLGDVDSQDLFRRVAYNGHACSDEDKRVVKECDGLPLALVSAAQFWSNTGNRTYEDPFHMFWDGDKTSARMRKVLGDEFYELPSQQLQDCLLYFAMFPSDRCASRNALMRRWLAEELVPADISRDKSEKQLRDLVDWSVIQQVKVGANGKAKRCKIHNKVMLRYVSDLCRLEEFVQCDGNRCTAGTTVYRLVLHNYDGADSIPALGSLSALRTLAVFPRTRSRSRSRNEAPALVVPLKVNLSAYKSLRVLEVEDSIDANDKHLEDICNHLVLLKYLRLGGSITKVPKQIAGLIFLETLDLRRSGGGEEGTVEVPTEAIMLPKLKHLLGRFRIYRDDAGWPGVRMKKLEKFLKENKSALKLETLAGFVVGGRRGFPRLMLHLSQLRKVKIWCIPSADKENLMNLLSGAIKRFIITGTNEEAGTSSRSLSIDFGRCNDQLSQLFMDSLHQPDNITALASLKLSGKLSRFPGFVAALVGITELSLSSTKLSWNYLINDDHGLKKLEFLKYLKLREDDPPTTEVDENGNEIIISIPISSEVLRGLVRLYLVSEQRLPKITVGDGALMQLTSLHLLYKVPSDLSGIDITRLQRLKEVALPSGVDQTTEKAWKNAATHHRNRPSFISANS